MMKFGYTVLVVDSVEKAVKFYSEKLGFDLVGLSAEKEGQHYLSYAQLKKGKCHLIVHVPAVDELAEFSIIKRCTGRGAGMYVGMKKGLDSYYQRCVKKGVTIITEPKNQAWGERTFVAKDPFGFRLTFAEPIANFRHPNPQDFCGFKVPAGPQGRPTETPELIEDMIKWLRGFGLLRRVAKKYSKLWIKKAKKAS